jgi:uncharacterized membrane protein YccC
MRAVQWLRQKDRDLVALRRAGRTAIVMPSLFAVGSELIGNPTIATFAAFGSFALLLLADFTGPMSERVQSELSLGLAGAVLVCLGTLASQTPWVAAIGMAIVAFAVLFAGVVSSVLASAAPSLLLAFILPAASKAPLSDIPDRLAGWGMASAVAVVAIWLLWPAPVRDRLRPLASAACRALAARLQADIDYRLNPLDPSVHDRHVQAVVDADAAVAALHESFLATPYRPTGLSTPARTVVRLVDEVNWLNAVVVKTSPLHKAIPVNHGALEVKRTAAKVLDCGAADLLDGRSADVAALTACVAALRQALAAMQSEMTKRLPVARIPESSPDGDRVVEIVSSLEPSFRAQELTFAVGQIATNIERTILADRRSWLDRMLGRQPQGLPGILSAAHERASAHLERHSVWLHNSVRGAVGLAAAIFVANLTGVQHSFWVVLGTLSVLRSNALNTGQNVLRGVAGTVIGFAIGAALLVPIGTNTIALWLLLPVAILIAGVAPAAISFAAGQAGFTLTLVILFNIVAPAGWRVGLVRIEDVAIGGAVSLVVGLLFWPRGAAAALGVALSEAYSDTAAYLASAVRSAVSHSGRPGGSAESRDPFEDSLLAAAASHRLDDTFRTYLGERGTKPVPISQVTGLLTGVASVRLAADAIVELWQPDAADEPGDRGTAGPELVRSAEVVQAWFDTLAGSFVGATGVPNPAPRDEVADGRLIDAVRNDLTAADGRGSATAVRVIWTGDHLDAVRRLEAGLVQPASTAIDRAGISGGSRPAWWPTLR